MAEKKNTWVRPFNVRWCASVKGKRGRQVEYFDSTERGLVLRINQSGAKSWRCAYRLHGKWTRVTIGKFDDLTLAEARTEVRRQRGQVADGKDLAGDRRAQRAVRTFNELADEYIALYAKPKKKSWREDERMIATYLRPTWGHRKANAITTGDAQTLVDAIAMRPAGVQANRVCALISKIFRWGRNRSAYALTHNPAQLVTRPGAETVRDRVLTDSEIRAVWNALDAENVLIRSLFRLRLLLAQRGAEVLQMRWCDLDLPDERKPDALAHGWWSIPAKFMKNVKVRNGAPHRVPLPPKALAIVRDLKAHAQKVAERRGAMPEWCFPSPVRALGHITNVMKALDRICTASNVTFTGHSLRHTASTRMAEAGIHEHHIDEVLSHVRSGVTRRVYTHYSFDREKLHALTVWERKLDAILSEQDEQTNVVPFARA